MSTENVKTAEEAAAELESAGFFENSGNSTDAAGKEEDIEEAGSETENADLLTQILGEVEKKEDSEEAEEDKGETKSKDDSVVTIIQQLSEKVGLKIEKEIEDSLDGIAELIEIAREEERAKFVAPKNDILSFELDEENIDQQREFLSTILLQKQLEHKATPTEKDVERAKKIVDVQIEAYEEEGILYEEANTILSEIKDKEAKKQQELIDNTNRQIDSILEKRELGNGFFISEQHKKGFFDYIRKPVKSNKTLSTITRENLTLHDHLKIDYLLYLDKQGFLKDLFKNTDKVVKTLKDLKLPSNKMKDINNT